MIMDMNTSVQKSYQQILLKIASVFFILLFPPLCGLYAMIGIFFSPHHWKKYLPFCIIFTFFLAYAYVPGTSGCDLLRYFTSVRECAELESWAQILSYKQDGCFVRNIIFWLIGKAGDVHLLPALSTATVYGVSGYITCSCASAHKQERLIPLLLFLQLVLLPYSSVIDNVRNVCSFSLITLAAYLDIIKEKRSIGVILLYILPCFIHTSSIILVVFRLLAFLMRKRAIKIATAISTILFPVIINFTYEHISWISFQGSFGDVLRTGIWKAWRYYNTPGGLDEYEKVLLASNSEPLYRLFEISFAIIILIFIFFRADRESDKWRRFNSYIFLICVITFACHVFITPHYWRFYCAVVVACPAVLIPMLQERRCLHKFLQLMLYGLIVYGIGGIMMNCWTLYHAVEWSEWIERALLLNPCIILFSLIKR